jgi:putative sterol carrier protein
MINLKKIIYLYIGDKWYLDMKNGNGSAGKGEPPSDKAQCTFKMSKNDFQSMFAGKLKPTAAFMGGKLKIQGKLNLFITIFFIIFSLSGDLPTALKLEKLLNQMVKSKL